MAGRIAGNRCDSHVRGPHEADEDRLQRPVAGGGLGVGHAGRVVQDFTDRADEMTVASPRVQRCEQLTADHQNEFIMLRMHMSRHGPATLRVNSSNV